MRPHKDESYADWAERVKRYELEDALKSLTAGEDIESVIDRMSTRIMKKMLHPLYKDLHKSFDAQFDLEESRKKYKELYQDKTAPVADHIDEQLFDNSEKK